MRAAAITFIPPSTANLLRQPLGSTADRSRSHLTGEVDETAARFPRQPSARSRLARDLLGRRFYDDRVAVFAGAVLATSFGYAFYAHRATADVERSPAAGGREPVYVFGNRGGRGARLWLLMATLVTKGCSASRLPIVVMGVDVAAWRIVERVGPKFDSRTWFGEPLVVNRCTLLALPLGVGVYCFHSDVGARRNCRSDWDVWRKTSGARDAAQSYRAV